MKLRLIPIASAMFGAVLLSGCNTTDDYPDDSVQLYQQYEVYIQDESKAGFANFRTGGPDAPRYALTGDMQVTVNGQKMLYTPQVSDTYPEFNYASFVETNTKEATFKFRRDKNRTLVNSISYGDIAYVTVDPSLRRFANRTQYSYTVNGTLAQSDDVHISLVPSIGGNDAKIYNAKVYSLTKTFEFTDVPAGTYNLRLDIFRVKPTAENDGYASGSMRVIRRKTLMEVKVTE